MLVPLVVVVGIALIGLMRSGMVPEAARRAAEDALSRALKQDVRIARASLSAGGVTLHDVRVRTNKGRPLFNAARVGVVSPFWPPTSLSWREVKSITIVRPTAFLERDKSGRWNIEAFLKRLRLRAKPGFSGRVVIRDGALVLKDASPPSPVRAPLAERLEAISAVLDFGLTPQVHFSVRAAHSSPRGVVHVAGQVNGSNVSATVTAEKVPVSDLLPYLVPVGSVQVLSGAADIRGQIQIGLRAGRPRAARQGAGIEATLRQYLIAIRPQECDVRLPWVRDVLRGVNGNLVVQGGKSAGGLRIEGVRARVGGADVVCTGEIAGWKRPVLSLDLDVRAQNVQRALEVAGLGRLPAQVRLRGPGQFQVSLTGPADNLTVRASGTTNAAILGAIGADQARARLIYSAGSLLVRDLRANVAGGRIEGSAWITTGRQQQAVFSGRMVSVRADALSRAVGADVRVSGNATGPVWARWDESGVRVVADAELSKGLAWDLPANHVYVDAAAPAQDGKSTRINRLVASSCGGQWIASGEVNSTGAIALKVAALGVDLAQVGRAVRAEGISGQADAWGHVSGTTQKPVFEGRIQAANAVVKGESFDVLSADVIASNREIGIKQGTAYRGTAEFQVTGAVKDIDWKRSRGVASLSLEFRQVPLAEVARMAKPPEGDQERAGGQVAALKPEMEGMVAGSVAISGPTDALQAQGRAELSDVQIGGQWLDSGRAEFRAQGREFELVNFEGMMGASVLSAHGTGARDGPLEIDFEAPELSLEDVWIERLIDAGIDFSGKAHVSGHIRGTAKEPVVEATVTSGKFSLGGNEFTDGQCAVRAEGDRVAAQGSAAQGAGQYRFSGSLEREAKQVNIEAWIERGDLGSIRSIAESLAAAPEEGSRLANALGRLVRAPRPLGGTVTAHVTASGPTDELAGEANIAVSDATLREQRLPDLEADLLFAGPRIKIEKARAASGQAYAVASGEIDLDGEMAVDIDAHNLSAGLLDPWVKSGIVLAGTGDASLNISGPTKSPRVVGSLEVSEFGASGVRFDRLRATRFEIEKETVVLDEILATRGPYQWEITGRVPFRWSPLSVPADKPLMVRVQAKNQDLSLLQTLFPGIEEAKGPLNADIVITGTRGKPVLAEGTLSVPTGYMKVADVGELRDIKARASARENVVSLQEFEAGYAQGRLKLAPDSTILVEHLEGGRLDESKFDVMLTAQGLRANLGKAAHGAVDADLHLTNGPDGLALLRGKVTALGGWEADISRAGGVSVMKPAAFDPALDVAMEIKAPAWARSAAEIRAPAWARPAAAEISLSGSGHVGGRLSAPQIRASLQGRRGWLLFPAGRFRITFAAADVTAYGKPGEPAGGLVTRTDLHIESEAVIAGYQVFLTITGPVDNPSVSARSVPALSSQEVNALITTGQPFVSGPTGGAEAATLSQVTRGVLGTSLSAVALQPVERAFAESLGLEEVSFEFRYGEPIRVRAGTFLLPGPLKGKLYLSYVRALAGAASTSSMRLTYDVRPALSLGMSIDERDVVRFEVQRTKRF